MNFLRTSWFFSKWCAGCLSDFLLGAVWLVLASLLLIQISLLFTQSLPMPDWMIRQIESRINAAGLKVKIESATIDTAGRVSVKNLQLAPHSLDSPLLKADEVYIRVNPLALLARHIEPRYIRASGVDLLLPAMLSPTGRTEAVLSNIHLAFKPDKNEIALDQFSGRLANLTFSVRGLLRIPNDMADSSAKKGLSPALLTQAIKTYVEIARKISEFVPELASLESPHLDLELTSSPDDLPSLALTLTSKKADFDLTRFRAKAGRLLLSDLKVTTTFNPFTTTPKDLSLQGSCSDAHTSKGSQFLGVNFILKGELPGASSPFKPVELLIKTDSATQTAFNGVDLKNTLIRLQTGKNTPLSTEIVTEAIGTSWHAQAQADTERKLGELKLEGAITPFAIQMLEKKIRMKPNTLLYMKAPAPITLTADFAAGWKLQKVLGRASFGPVVGYHVPFSSGTARFSFDGTELSVTDIDATQGDHAAVGSYWMNIKTLDFRFLLTGHLRPLGISGFFSEWWPNFFNHFDFTPVAPAASVDIGGRWTFPHTTTVFVNADARHPTINHVQFDRVRTTMFIRPDFYDALEFIVNEGEQTARGTFTRTVDVYRHGDNLRTIDFNLNSTLNLAESAKIFGPAGTEIVEPFTFTNPPALQLAGRIDGVASPDGPHRFIQMSLKSTGGFALHGFPLNDLSFVGTIKDDTIDLHDIQVAYARGLAQGKIFLSGPEAERRLNFDIALKGAYLGEAVSTMEQFIARQKGEAPGSSNRFQQIPDVRLDLALAAKGRYHEPLSFQGHGAVDLSGAQLAQINLLGSLSKALSKNSAFSFTTLQLNHAKSSLALDREKLFLPDLKISGNSTVIEGSGTYLLDKKTMDFTAKVYPFGQGKTLLSSAVGFVLVPITHAMELRLSGTLEQPNWRFAYGPRSFLYNLTGTNPNEAAIIPEQTPTDITRRLPPPYLRR